MSDKLELMLEAERRGILPPEKTELLAEARRRGLVPGGAKPVYGSKEDVTAEAERRQGDERQRLGYTTAVVGDALTLGAAPKIFGGAKGLTNYAVKKFKGEETDLPTEYARERDIYRAQERGEEEEAGPWKSTAGGIAAGLATGPAKVAVGAAPVVEKAVEKGGKVVNFLVDKARAAGYGAAFGGVYGFNRSDEGLAEKATSAKDHAIAGAVLAPIVKTGLDTVGAVRSWRADKKQARADVANERAQAFVDADVPIYPPALNDTANMAARSLEGNIMAAPLREKARLTADALERNLEAHFKANDGLSPAETAGRLREFLRQQLLGDGVDPGLVKNATPEQLSEMAGLPSLKPPKVEPVKAERVPPISQDEYLRGVEQGVLEVAPQMPASLEGRYTAPKIEEVPLSKQLETELPKAHAEHADMRRKFEANQRLIDEHEAPIKERGRALNLGEIKWQTTNDGGFFVVDVPNEGRIYTRFDGKIITQDGNPAIVTPERQQLIKDSIDFMTNHPVSEIRTGQPELKRQMEAADLRRQALEKEAFAYRTEMQPVIAEQRRAQALKEAQEMAQAEAALATQKARTEAVERARPQATQEAMKLQSQRQAEADAAAAAETALKQAQATSEHARSQNRPFELGDSPLPIKNQLDAAYDQVRANAPAIQPNLLGEKATKTTPEIRTNTVNLIDDIAKEARRRSELVGYKDGKIFDPETKRVHGDIMDYLRDRIGDDLIKRLAVYADKRATGGFVPNIKGIHDLRTDLRAAVRDADGWNPGTTAPRDVAMLKRFVGAVDADLRAFANQTGERGRTYIRQLDMVDAQYERYMNDMRKPLAKLLDDKTDRGAIYQDLVKSMRDGATNMDTLERVYGLLDKKGGAGPKDLNRAQLTASLVGDMAKDGLPAFVKAWDKLSPDARAIMFQGSSEALGAKLDAIAKAGKLMDGHLDIAKTSELDPRQLMRMSNLLLGTLSYVHLPSAIAQAVGTNAAARILSSKWYAGWLRSAPTKPIGSGEWTRHMERMVGYAGEVTSNNPEAVRGLREAIGIKDANALFLGERSETANKDSLEEAKALEKKRTDAKDIYHKTGWFKGKDKKWRYEIDDQPAKLTSEANSYYKHVQRKLGDIDTTLGAIIKHDELYKAFPEAKDIKVRLLRVKEANKAAEMETDETESSLSWGAVWDSPTKTMIVNVQAILSRDDFRSTVLHEVQHYLQDVNDFDYGPLSGDYNRRYGEVEAYNVQKREKMDPQQRRLSYPPSTQGVTMKDILLSKKKEAAK